MQLNEKNMEPGKYPQWAEKFQRKQKEFSKVSYFIMICMKRQVPRPERLPHAMPGQCSLGTDPYLHTPRFPAPQVSWANALSRAQRYIAVH